MLSTRSSPAVISAAAASKLPRAALLTLLIAFVVPLFFSSDVWHGRSLTSFGVAWTMANGSFSDWLFPNINGIAVNQVGPLSSWVAAIVIAVLGRWVGDIVAYHVSGAIWFAITTASIWYGTYYLSRRDEAQPVSFAFGGEAARKDYGRLVADIAVLMTLSAYGLIVAFHELTAVTALLALSALTLFGIILSLQHLWRGSILAGVAVGSIVLAGTPGIGLWSIFAVWVAIFLTPDYTSRTKRAFITLSAALITTLSWPLLVFVFDPAHAALWFRGLIEQSFMDFSPLAPADYIWLIKNLAWLTFPLWPLAFWGLYAWRGHLRQAPIAIPLAFLSVALCSILFTGTEMNSTILYVVPSLAILSSLGVVSLKRSKENFLDLYSGIIYSLAVIVVWIYFYAWTQGTPAKMGYSITRLAPGAGHGTSAFLLSLAALATFLWFTIVFWRLKKHPVNYWRGAWMSASGLTAVWIVVLSLFNPVIEGARSVRPIAESVRFYANKFNVRLSELGERNLPMGDIAAVNYWGKIKFTSQPRPQWILTAVEKGKLLPYPLRDEYRVLTEIPGRPRSALVYLLMERFPQIP